MKMPAQPMISTVEDALFVEMLEREDRFYIRRAVERLREGLFDPVAVRLLTAREELLRAEMERGLAQVEAGERPHLCIAGSYGQGKSHGLVYMEELALGEGFPTSRINLDPREIPFHNFRAVYRELLRNLKIPGSDESFPMLWEKWGKRQAGEMCIPAKSVVDIIPDDTPHLFKAVLAAMCNSNISLTNTERGLKKHASFRRKEFTMLLARTLEGEAIPANRLRKILKYRQVPFYRDESLKCLGYEPFLLMIVALSKLFRAMGYRGWVVLFDEAESIAQANVFARSKCYMLLNRLMFATGKADPGYLFPIFAFTDDFFQRVRDEDYDRRHVRRGIEVSIFERNYARNLKDLNVYRLCDFSRNEWKNLSERLLRIHAHAYRWRPGETEVVEGMARRLERAQNRDTRFKLKALVECLDLAHQEQVLK